MQYQIIYFSIVLFFTTLSYAVDMNSNGFKHPHGVSSSGLDTIVNIKDNTFTISGGTIKNTNLFHSFDQFNIHKGETAIFNDSGFQNTIGRVTGCNYSWINGIINSNADNLYMINNNGFIFGSNAKLNLAGSFYISSCDYIKFDDQSKFFSSIDKNSTLTYSSPNTFGFLTNNVKPILFNIDNNKISNEIQNNFSVKLGKTLSIIGGDIEIINIDNSTTLESIKNSSENIKNFAISSPEGEINIISVGSEGEVINNDLFIYNTSNPKYGTIKISDNNLNVSGNYSGSIYIKGENIFINNSAIYAESLSNDKKQIINKDISGSVNIDCDNITFSNGSFISGNTNGLYNGETILIKAKENVIFKGIDSDGNVSKISIETNSKDESAGNGGTLEIQAGKDILFKDGAYISDFTFGKGNAGTIKLKSDYIIEFSGQSKDKYINDKFELFFVEDRTVTPGGIYAVATPSSNGGKGGDIYIESNDIILKDACPIFSASIGGGCGGNISIKANGLLSLSGSFSHDFWTSAIAATVMPVGPETIGKNSGNVYIEAGEIIMKDGAFIASSTISDFGYKAGNAGSIDIKVNGKIDISGVNPYGREKIVGRSGIYVYSWGKEDSVGTAGTIYLSADSLILKNGASITVSTKGNSDGGNIDIKVNEFININGDSLSEHFLLNDDSNLPGGINYHISGIYANTIGEGENAGMGGNIKIRANEIYLSDKGTISTSSEGPGNAGIIEIETNKLNLNSNSSITSSSKSINIAGHPGIIDIIAHDIIEMNNNSSIDISSIGSNKLNTNNNIGDNSDFGIFLKGNKLENNQSIISSATKGELNGGTIKININNIYFSNGGIITGDTYKTGKGSNIYIEDSDIVRFSDIDCKGIRSGIYSQTNSKDNNAGEAGKITINANDIIFENGAILSILSEGKGNGGEISTFSNKISFLNGSIIKGNTLDSGDGGNVTIKTKESVKFAGIDIDGDTSKINIQTESKDENAGHGGTLNIESEGEIIFSDGAYIMDFTFGKGNAGEINLKSNNIIEFSGQSKDKYINEVFESFFGEDRIITPGGIYAVATPDSNGGKGGDIYLESNDIILKDACPIFSASIGGGCGGNISIKANGLLSLSGAFGHDFWTSAIAATVMPVGKDNIGQHSGNVDIEAGNLRMKDGAFIASSTISVFGNKSGDAGEVNIKVKGTIHISGVNPYGRYDIVGSTGIYVYSWGKDDSVGKAGVINLSANSLILENGGSITVSCSGNSNGGDINLDVNELIKIEGDSLCEPFWGDNNSNQPGGINYHISGIYATSESSNINSGSGGNITAKAKNLTLSNKAMISTYSNGGGNAGNISLNVNNFNIQNMSMVSSASKALNMGGAAGKIKIYSNDSIILNDNCELTTEAINMKNIDISKNEDTPKNEFTGMISLETNNLLYSYNSKINTSVMGGSGNGGDINIKSDNYIILNHSSIIANAYEGKGGNIKIIADQFLQSVDSKMTASSEIGIDGSVNIQSNIFDLAKEMGGLPSKFTDATQWMKTPCSDRYNENVSRLIFSERDGIVNQLDDWLPSTLITNNTNCYKNEKINFFINEGIEYYNTGKYKKSVNSWLKALKLIENINSEKFYIMYYLANAYQMLGLYKNSTIYYNSLKELTKTNIDLYKLAMFYSSYGDYLLSIGEVYDAISILEKGKIAAEDSKNPYLIANILNNLAVCLEVFGNPLRAHCLFTSSLNFINEIKIKNQYSKNNIDNLKTRVLINLARLNLSLKQITQENQFHSLLNAYNNIINIDNPYEKVRYLLTFSLLKRVGKNNTIIQYFNRTNINILKESLKIVNNIKNEFLISCVFGYMGMHYSDINLSEAIKNTKKAIFYAQQIDCPELLYLWYWKLAQYYSKKSEISKAIVQYKNTIDILNQIKNAFFKGSRDRKDIFNTKIKPVYLELVQLYIKQSENSSNKNYRTQKLKFACEIMEMLKTAELQNFYQDDCLQAKNKVAMNTMNKKSAILYQILFNDSIYLLLISSDNIISHKVQIDYNLVKYTVETFREELEEYDNYKIEAMQIYDWIINPIEKEIIKQNINTLIIVPDGILCLIPFASLYDGDMFLIEKYALAIIPALSVTDTKKSYNNNKQALIVGLTKGSDEFPALPKVIKEIETVKSIMGGKILQDRYYTKNSLDFEIKYNNYSVLHMATHGFFGGASDQTFLLTYDGKLTLNDLHKLLNNNQKYTGNITLLTLSACDTAIGDERAAFGLAGIAVKAGVKSTLATLWSVDDNVAYIFAENFYNQLQNDSISKAKAFKNCINLLLSSNKYNHPGFWAPFVLIGNWM